MLVDPDAVSFEKSLRDLPADGRMAAEKRLRHRHSSLVYPLLRRVQELVKDALEGGHHG